MYLPGDSKVQTSQAIHQIDAIYGNDFHFVSEQKMKLVGLSESHWNSIMFSHSNSNISNINEDDKRENRNLLSESCNFNYDNSSNFAVKVDKEMFKK
ncbi:CLUMA_CG004566, isoform A [Clunio marinus]|uniref:CLUMA_CG004566, isoform A n=1 Tax=Clunio marinus TaxID=568069 RepID=A0A1J1HU30_9DIPT|nr:CLUMA_CG004566, isoform A [Clunio marinus]